MPTTDLSLGHTPIRNEQLQNVLQLYPDEIVKNELLDGFQNGFKLHYNGPRGPVDCNNLISVRQNENLALNLVNKEIQLGRIAGPFLERPFPSLRLSPIGLVPKKDGAFRLIQHLSYPKGASVNDFIDPQLCTIQYASFDNAIALLNSLGPGALMGKMDIKSAFRLLPIHPSDFELLGFCIGKQYFYDKCLPMGCSISCSLFEKFATSLEWAVRQRCLLGILLHYLDDFFFGGRNDTNDCSELMNAFATLCFEVGVPIADEKTVGPTDIITFLGLIINSSKRIISIPELKILELRHLLSELLVKKKTTLKQLQSLTGSLNFCARAIPAIRTYCGHFYRAMSSAFKPHHFIRISMQMREDIRMLLLFLDLFNGTCYFPESDWELSSSFNLFTDAAGGSALGCAAYLGTNWVFFEWPGSFTENGLLRDVSLLELLPIVLAFHCWGERLKGKKIVLHTDNMALVSILNNKYTKNSKIMLALRPLVLQALLFNIQFKAEHVPGKANVIADALSRKQWTRFRLLAPDAAQEPSPIPDLFHHLISQLELTDF